MRSSIYWKKFDVTDEVSLCQGRRGLSRFDAIRQSAQHLFDQIAKFRRCNPIRSDKAGGSADQDTSDYQDEIVSNER